jgi:MOSC domain-containing protein YiiM
VTQLDTAALEAGLHDIRQSPSDRGTVELIARRPAVDQREIIPEGELDPEHGLVGDTWAERPSRRTGQVHVERQVTLMNSRVADLVAGGDKARWALAGDQLYVDFDLGQANLPPGTRLAVGAAELEVSAEPHTGCDKFTERFGRDAMRFVNSAEGRALSLRGINARVVTAGPVRVGDTIRKA